MVFTSNNDTPPSPYLNSCPTMHQRRIRATGANTCQDTVPCIDTVSFAQTLSPLHRHNQSKQSHCDVPSSQLSRSYSCCYTATSSSLKILDLPLASCCSATSGAEETVSVRGRQFLCLERPCLCKGDSLCAKNAVSVHGRHCRWSHVVSTTGGKLYQCGWP
jgi:hypothetical protein